MIYMSGQIYHNISQRENTLADIRMGQRSGMSLFCSELGTDDMTIILFQVILYLFFLQPRRQIKGIENKR